MSQFDINHSDENCIFCKIISNKIPSPRVFENEQFICIRDIQPQAKTHFLLIPRVHVPSLDEAFAEQSPALTELMGKLLKTATEIARKEKLLPSGFRIVINTKSDAGQSVDHMHLHLLGGAPLSEHFA